MSLLPCNLHNWVTFWGKKNNQQQNKKTKNNQQNTSLKGRSDALQGVVCISDKTTWACSVLFVIPPGFPGARKHFCIVLPNSASLQHWRDSGCVWAGS